jgi:hypothetical protein
MKNSIRAISKYSDPLMRASTCARAFARMLPLKIGHLPDSEYERKNHQQEITALSISSRVLQKFNAGSRRIYLQEPVFESRL